MTEMNLKTQLLVAVGVINLDEFLLNPDVNRQLLPQLPADGVRDELTRLLLAAWKFP